MTQDLITLLEEKRDSLTPSQRIIANRLASDPMDGALSTVSEYAQKNAVSTATIVRFANCLGFDGFADFQQYLKTYLQIRTNPIKRFDNNFKFSSSSPLGDKISKICELQFQSLQQTFSEPQDDKFELSVRILSHAERIYTVGTRGSHSITSYLGHHINRVFSNCEIISDYSKIPDYLIKMTQDDVLIIVNMPRYDQRLINMAKIAYKRNIRIIVITDSELSPYRKYANVLFQAGNYSIDFHNSLLPAMLIAEILLSLLFSSNADRVRERLTEIEPIFKEMEFFIE